MDAGKSVSGGKAAKADKAVVAQGGRQPGKPDALQGKRAAELPALRSQAGGPTLLGPVQSQPLTGNTALTGNRATGAVPSATQASPATPAPRKRILFIPESLDAPRPLLDHLQECVHIVGGREANNSVGIKLLKAIACIPCATEFYPRDAEFFAAFKDVVSEFMGSGDNLAELKILDQRWTAFQEQEVSSKQSKVSVWIKLFRYAISVAEAMQAQQQGGGQAKPAAPVDKWFGPVDALRNALVDIHQGGADVDDPSVPGSALRPEAKADDGETAAASPRKRRASMKGLFAPVFSPDKKAKAPCLPQENAAGFDTKIEVLSDWAARTDRLFDKHGIGRALMVYFNQSTRLAFAQSGDLYLIAYKVLANVVFTEWTQGACVADAVLDAAGKELGYVNEVLIACQKLKSITHPDSRAPLRRAQQHQLWLNFFGPIGELMKAKRYCPDENLPDTAEVRAALSQCELAYESLVKEAIESAYLTEKRLVENEATKKRTAASKKARREKGRSMNFTLMPSEKKKKAAFGPDFPAFMSATPRAKGPAEEELQEKPGQAPRVELPDEPGPQEIASPRGARRGRRQAYALENDAVVMEPAPGSAPAQALQKPSKKPGRAAREDRSAVPAPASERTAMVPAEAQRREGQQATAEKPGKDEKKNRKDRRNE